MTSFSPEAITSSESEIFRFEKTYFRRDLLGGYPKLIPEYRNQEQPIKRPPSKSFSDSISEKSDAPDKNPGCPDSDQFGCQGRMENLGGPDITGLSRKWTQPEWYQMVNQQMVRFKKVFSWFLNWGVSRGRLIWQFRKTKKMRFKTWHTVISGKPPVKITSLRKTRQIILTEAMSFWRSLPMIS